MNYDDGNGEKEFTIEITPDDSVEAGSTNKFFIEGKDGNQWKCRDDVSVTVGQSRGATISLGNTALYDIPPGQDDTTTLTVTNTGNGQDMFRVTALEIPAGWSVTLESTTITTESRFNNAEKSGTIEVTISLPLDALAIEEETIVFSVLPKDSGGAYDTAELLVTVKEIHGMSGESPADDQTGRSDTTVQFPINIKNEGNTLDRYRFSVISQTAQPPWGKHFETENGEVVNEIDIPPQQTITMYLVVSIDGEEELESTRLTVRVMNLGDNNNGDDDENGVPDNQLEFIFRAILSDRNFAMDAVIMNNADDLSRNEALILPPGGTRTYELKVTNTGDLKDEAIFDFNGLSGIATPKLTYRGMPIEGPITIEKGWGAFNESTGRFYFVDNEPLLASTSDKIFEKIVENGLVDSHVQMPFYAIITLEIEVNSGAENGDGGLLEIVVTSVSNAANRSGKVAFSLSVETVLDAELFVIGDDEKDITFGQIGKSPKFEVDVVNAGNIESEFKIFSSGGVRGWNVILSYESGADCQDKGDHILCNIPAGETVQITVKVNAPGGDTAEVEDTFTFTLSTEPTDVGLAGRENIKLTVNGQPEPFAWNSYITPNVLYGIGALVLIGFASLLLRRRN